MTTIIAGLVFAAAVVGVVAFARNRTKKADAPQPPVGSGGTSGPKPEAQ